MADDMRQALDERRDLIEKRADAVLDSALSEGAAWTKALGSPPRPQAKRHAWLRKARIVADYRDRYGITDDTPLGPTPVATAQKIDAARAKTALDRARSVTVGLRWGVPAMALAIPYLYAASICAQVAEDGGPGWPHLLMMLFIWNALKFAFIGPISLVLLIRVRLREVPRSHRAVDVGAAQ